MYRMVDIQGASVCGRPFFYPVACFCTAVLLAVGFGCASQSPEEQCIAGIDKLKSLNERMSVGGILANRVANTIEEIEALRDQGEWEACERKGYRARTDLRGGTIKN
jgi:hypothetical protein